MAVKFIELDKKGNPFQVKVSAADAPEDKYLPLARGSANSFSDVENGFEDDILGKVTKDEALKYFHNGWNLARRQSFIAANSLDKKVDSVIKRLASVAKAAGTELTPEQEKAFREQFAAMGIV